MNKICQNGYLSLMLSPRATIPSASAESSLLCDASRSHASIDVLLEIAVDDARRIAIRHHLARIRYDLATVNLRRHRMVIERRGDAACLKIGECWWFEFNRPSRPGKLIREIGKLIAESDWAQHCIGTVL